MLSWIRIRIGNANPVPTDQNQCGSGPQHCPKDRQFSMGGWAPPFFLNSYYVCCIQNQIEKSKKKRTVTVRGVIIFLNIPRRPLRICLHCCLHQYKTLKAVATAMAMIVLLTPAKNLNKVFWVFLVVSPLFNHYQGYE